MTSWARDDGDHTALELSRLRIDAGSRTVHLDGETIELRRLEFDLLWHLASHPRVAFTREELLRAVWSSSAEWQKVTTVTEHVRRIRAKLERDPGDPQWIRTVNRLGYLFDPAGGEERERATDVVESMQVASVVIVGTAIEDASSGAADLLGVASRRDLCGRDVFDFVPPQSVDAVRRRQQEAAAGRWPRPERVTLRRDDGVELEVDLSSTPVVFEDRAASQVTMWLVSSPSTPP